MQKSRLAPIKQDAIAEEVFAARLYAKRLTRTVVIAQSVVLVLFVVQFISSATRPAKRIYIKLDDFGRATPIRYQDLEHYTPDAAVAKSYFVRLGKVSLWQASGYGPENLPEKLSVPGSEVRPAD